MNTDAPRAFDLDGVRMRTAATDASGVVSSDTILTFRQRDDHVFARYLGGAIVDGYLLGAFDARGALTFRYIQLDVNGNLDAGTSTGTFERLPDGRLRLTESFKWFTRPERGTNVFEQIADDKG